MTSDLELVRGTFDLILLKCLSWGPMHGLGVLRWIEHTTGQRLLVEEGALYPALHRLEQKKWLVAEWGTPRTTGARSTTGSRHWAGSSWCRKSRAGRGIPRR